jgi:hypothetical protein
MICDNIVSSDRNSMALTTQIQEIQILESQAAPESEIKIVR